jgi:hypothetical protein
MQQAEGQARSRNLTVENGWVYFLHAWSEMIAEAFHLDLIPALLGRLDEDSPVTIRRGERRHGKSH